MNNIGVEWIKMQAPKITIIKIGGSVLTNKGGGRPVFQTRTALRIARELLRYKKTSREGFVLVHGAGSFAHPLAKRYRIQDPDPGAKNELGAAKTHLGAKKLNMRVAETFIKIGCPVIPISPFSFVVQDKGRIASFDTDAICVLINQGLVPLLHGDVVCDKSWKFSVCSGDQIVSFLSAQLRATRVLFATDVDGIAAQDPKKSHRPGFFKRLTKKRAVWLAQSTISSRSDVTGTMGGKLLEISKMRGDVAVFSGLKRGNLLAVLQGKSRGTLVA